MQCMTELNTLQHLMSVFFAFFKQWFDFDGKTRGFFFKTLYGGHLMPDIPKHSQNVSKQQANDYFKVLQQSGQVCEQKSEEGGVGGVHLVRPSVNKAINLNNFIYMKRHMK